ncbi:MAG: glycosyltransferase family 4 protein [Candidatus Micrarchaeota archaeon]
MKIAMVCPFFLPVVGGMEKHVYNLSRELVRKGHGVTVFTSKIGHDGKTLKKTEETIDGIRVRRYPPYFRIGRFASFWPQFTSELGNFDIIHAHNLRHPHAEISLWKGKLSRIPVVLTPHSPYHEGTHSMLQEGAIRLYDEVIGRFSLRNFDAIFALHKDEQNWLERRGVNREKIFIIPNGIEAVFFKHEMRSPRRSGILFVGRLNKVKGLDLLLRAFKRVIGRRKCRLSLIGPDGGYEGELKRLAKDLGIERNVYFQGEVSESKLISFLDSAEVFVLPSKYEPFGISLVEAMARQGACIATNAGGPKWIIRHGKNGLLVNYDEVEMANAILKLLNDKKLAKTIGKKAAESARRYSWKQLASDAEAVYGKLVRKK